MNEHIKDAGYFVPVIEWSTTGGWSPKWLMTSEKKPILTGLIMTGWFESDDTYICPKFVEGEKTK